MCRVPGSRVMSPREDANRRLLRARDAMDREYARPLDVAALARIALMSTAHFTREFARAFGETPHLYLQRRRIERAMTLLRHSSMPITDIALAVGFSSLGTFGRTFRRIVGCAPGQFRDSTGPLPVPGCAVMAWTRPSAAMSGAPAGTAESSSFGEAVSSGRP
jgi:transcriptional regulator GlxA family with amidase domain